MAFSQEWNEATPPGSAPANSIADIIRSLETQVRERLESIVGITDLATQTDPIHITRLLFTAVAWGYLRGGTSGLALRNNAGDQDNLKIEDDGDVTVRKDLSVLGSIITPLVFDANFTMEDGNAMLLKSNVAMQLAQFNAYRHDKGNINGAVTFDWNQGNWQMGTLTANVTPTFTNPKAGARYIIELKQGNLGSYGFTGWPANVYWPGGAIPTPSTSIGRRDVVELLYDGTNYLGREYAMNYNIP